MALYMEKRIGVAAPVFRPEFYADKNLIDHGITLDQITIHEHARIEVRPLLSHPCRARGRHPLRSLRVHFRTPRVRAGNLLVPLDRTEPCDVEHSKTVRASTVGLFRQICRLRFS